MAADGFHERCSSLAPGFLEGAEGVGALFDAEDAVLAADDGGDEFARGVVVGYALTVDDAAGLGAEVVLDVGQDGFDLGNLVECDGSAGVAFDAAGAVTGAEVAGELLPQDIERDNDVADLNHVVFLTFNV